MEPPIWLSDAALRGLGVTPAEARAAIEAALAAQRRGELATAPKAALVPGDGRYMMATLSAGPHVSVVKTVTVAPDNPGRGVPGIMGSIMGSILVHDAGTGALRAAMDAAWVTELRTAGLSAVAAARLAHPASERLAFVGCGAQARSHLTAFADLFPLREIAAFGRGAANRERLCAMARNMGLKAEAANTPEAALRGADLVVTSVTLDFDLKPFLDAAWLKPGAFAAITDLGLPWRPEGWGRFGSIHIDDRAQEAASPHKMVPPERVTGDLSDLVGGPDPGPSPDAPTAFVFRGIALGDYAVAALALDRARAARLGQPLG